MLKRGKLNRKVNRLHVVCAQRKSKKTQVLIGLNGEIDSSTIIGEFNTTFSITDRSLRQKINRKTADSNSTRDQMGLTDDTGLSTQEQPEDTSSGAYRKRPLPTK